MKKHTDGRQVHVPTKEEMDGFMDTLEKAWNKEANLSFCQLVGSAMAGDSVGSRFYNDDAEAMMDMEAIYKKEGFASFGELTGEFGVPKTAARRTMEQISSFLKKIRKMCNKNSQFLFVDLVSEAVMGKSYKTYLKDSELMRKLKRRTIL